jgi:hypothetical protein
VFTVVPLCVTLKGPDTLPDVPGDVRLGASSVEAVNGPPTSGHEDTVACRMKDVRANSATGRRQLASR